MQVEAGRSAARLLVLLLLQVRSYQVGTKRYQVGTKWYQAVPSGTKWYQAVSSGYQVVSSGYQAVSSGYQVVSSGYQAVPSGIKWYQAPSVLQPSAARRRHNQANKQTNKPGAVATNLAVHLTPY